MGMMDDIAKCFDEHLEEKELKKVYKASKKEHSKNIRDYIIQVFKDCFQEETKVKEKKLLVEHISGLMKKCGMKSHYELAKSVVWSEFFYEEFAKNKLIRVSDNKPSKLLIAYLLSEYAVEKSGSDIDYFCATKLIEDEFVTNSIMSKAAEIRTRFYLIEINANLLGKYRTNDNNDNWFTTLNIINKSISFVEKRCCNSIEKLKKEILLYCPDCIYDSSVREEFCENIYKITILQCEDIELIKISDGGIINYT